MSKYRIVEEDRNTVAMAEAPFLDVLRVNNGWHLNSRELAQKVCDLLNTEATPTTLLSEGKETVSDDWKDQLIRHSCTDKIQSEDLYIYALGFQRCIEWQSQHTAKEIEALQARVRELEVKLGRVTQQKETIRGWFMAACESKKKWKEPIENYLDTTTEQYKQFIEDNELD